MADLKVPFVMLCDDAEISEDFLLSMTRGGWEFIWSTEFPTTMTLVAAGMVETRSGKIRDSEITIRVTPPGGQVKDLQHVIRWPPNEALSPIRRYPLVVTLKDIPLTEPGVLKLAVLHGKEQLHEMKVGVISRPKTDLHL